MLLRDLRFDVSEIVRRKYSMTGYQESGDYRRYCEKRSMVHTI